VTRMERTGAVLEPGDVIDNRVVVWSVNGKTPTPIDPKVSLRLGSSSERCAIYGGKRADRGE
jgi:hypothetical protein